MKIAVDGWRIHGTTGVARYIVNVIGGWHAASIPKSIESATIITPRPIDRSRVKIPDGVQEHVVQSDSPQIIWQNSLLRRECDADVLWCPAYVAPVRCSARIVVTTHDATNQINPELYPIGDRIFYRRFYAWCARRASLVITNSEQTMEDIQRYYRVPAEKIRVVPLAPAAIFRKVEGDNVNDTRLRLVGDTRPYFLSVGKISVRRNVPTIIQAFARFRERTGMDYRLIVVGRNGLDREIAEIARELRISDHCMHLDYVTDDELVDLYNNADAFVTAATYEANSFTTLEAQATGTPVIIPDVPGMRQMTADIAIITPSISAEDIAEAMRRLALDIELREDLARRGLEHAALFSWERTSSGILSVLEEAALEKTLSLKA